MPNWKKVIVSGSDASLNKLDITTDVTASNLSITDTATYNTVEFTNSNIMKFNQRYTGGANGTYFTNGEYQKVVTITPSAASENYQVVGRMTAQNAGETHTVYFNAALRSVTLTDLTWTVNYDEEYNASRYIDPQLWVKETATAGFIIAFETLATIYGSVTIDFDVIPRAASQKANVTINQVTDSEQTSIDSGFTAYDMQRNLRNQNGDFTISGSLAIEGINNVSASLASIESTSTSQTLQDVTDNGATTTNDIQVSSSFNVTGSLDVVGPGSFNGDVTMTGGSKIIFRNNDTAIWEGSGLNLDSGASSRSINFRIGGSEKVRIDDTTGNVGIGTTSPNAALDVNGDAFIQNNGSLQASGSGYLRTGNANGGTVLIGGDGSISYIQSQNNRLVLQTSRAEDDIEFKVGENAATSSMFIDGANSRIGIGTTTPSAVLDIENADGVTIDVNSSSGDGLLRFQDAGVSKWFVGRDNTNQSFAFSYEAGLGLANVVTLTSTGNVGIGTSTPTEKLTVEGNISGSGNLVIEGDITGSALRLNNLGAQNEIVIVGANNEVTSSNILSLDTTNNYLGINQSNPEVTLHMTGEGAQTAQIRMEQHNDSGDAPDIRTRRTRGTADSPTAVNAGDFIYRQNHEYYTGTEYRTVGQFAVDTNSSNADRFQLTLAVSEDGTAVDAADNQFKIDGNDGGAITFNGSYKFPTSDGTNGQALITNGSGVLSFGAPTADLNGTGVVSGSDQLEGFVSKSADFTANEIIIADGTNSVVSTDLLTIDPGNNRVGVGTSSPSTKFHIAGDGNNEGQIRLQQANNGGDGPDIAFYSSRGTIASPSAVQNNDTHGRINAYPYNGTSFVQAGSFGWSATDGTGNNTFDIRTRVNGTLANRIEITSAGDVDISGSLTAQSATVDDFTINDTLTAPTITGSLLRLSENGSGLRLTNVGGFEPQSGVFNIFGNNDVTFGAGGSGASERVLTLVESNRHAQFEAAVSASVFSGSFVGDGSGLTGVTATTPTLQQVTDQGATTTNDISVTGSLNVTEGDIVQQTTQGGNTLTTTAGSQIIGSNHVIVRGDNSYVRLQSDNNSIQYRAFGSHIFSNENGSTEHLRIDSSGNVGIGTTAPQELLHIASNSPTILFDYTNSNQNQFRIQNQGSLKFIASGSNAGGDFVFVDKYEEETLRISAGVISNKVTITGSLHINNAITQAADTNISNVFGKVRLGSYVTDYAYFSHYDHGSNSNYALRQAPNGSTQINAATGQGISFNVNNNGKVFIDSTGNFGILNTNPDAALDVTTNGSGNGIDIRANTSNAYAQIKFYDNSHATASATITTYLSGSTFAGDLAFRTANYLGASAERMRITNEGNVGIGTTAPVDKLHVDGNVTASAYYGDGSNLTGISTQSRIPKVEYLALTASIASDDVESLPNSLSYTTSSDGYEYLEIFLDGIRLNRTYEYSEVNTTQVRYLLNIPSGSILTYKSLTLV